MAPSNVTESQSLRTGLAKREQIAGAREHHEEKITASIDFSTTIPTMTMLLHIVPTINSTN
jgi:hypothetical protein